MLHLQSHVRKLGGEIFRLSHLEIMWVDLREGFKEPGTDEPDVRDSMDLGQYIIFCICAVNAVVWGCPPQCQCKNSKISCSGYGIKDFPTPIPTNTSILSIYYTNLTSLKPADFESFSETLTELGIGTSKIREVHPQTFNKTLHLISLVLQETELFSLPEHLFAHLQALKSLNLRKNMLTSIPEKIFQGLINLEKLVLQDNNIRTLYPETFHGLHKLKLLSLKQNKLEVISGNVFEHLVNLESLHLQNNVLNHLPAELFNHTPKLQKLYLSNNKIEHLPDGIFLNLPNLQQISLYDNQLQTLSPNTFGPMPLLQELWLYNNHLTRLDKNIFSNLSHIKLLVVSKNQISNISPGAFNGLNELKEISLQSNHLTSLEEDVFRGLPNLVSISLRNNLLHHLPGKLLEGLTFLQQLEIQNNSLDHLSEEFLHSLANASNVVLAENPWRCDHDIVPLRDWLLKNQEKVNSSSSLKCVTPAWLMNMSIINLKNHHLQTSTEANLSKSTRIAPTALPNDRTTRSSANTISVSEKEDHTHGQWNLHAIIIAAVCTVVLVTIGICVVCWRRNKRRGSQNIEH
ncbi:Leucine-rich repeat-containing protein 15 [Bagarius yarrelli]|uniref:Leucine-rich repeat-containing protein 15 n=1 Tax=Bagarius yarrelli TaxID=175774 RepID=A0A556TR52_BAGYA|nr:Leucine-rich repeat-containing protein 15 [Bagarius yarrelli]